MLRGETGRVGERARERERDRERSRKTSRLKITLILKNFRYTFGPLQDLETI